MSTIFQITNILKAFAPEEHVFKPCNDNVGLLLGNDKAIVKKVLVCLDATDAVIDEAIALQAQLIISHHPFIFAPIKRINARDLLGKKIIKAIANGINIYSSHTNLDFVAGGINDFLASGLGLRNISPLDPYIDSQAGFGRVGELPNKMPAIEFKELVAQFLKDKNTRLIAKENASVKRIAVINGAGGADTSSIDMALKAGADCLVTADVKHHVAIYASELNLTIIEPDHYSSEHIFINRLTQILKIEAKSQNLGVEILQSKQDKNPRL